MKLMFHRKSGIAFLALSLVMSLLASCAIPTPGNTASSGGNKGTVTVASKDFTE